MNPFTLVLLITSAMPVPSWLAARKPMPVPVWVVTAPQSSEEALATHHPPEPKPPSPADLATSGKRLPGPQYWQCPVSSCRSPSCLMYLGGHLRDRNRHKQSMSTLNRVTEGLVTVDQIRRRYFLLHDNLHNAPRVVEQPTSKPVVVKPTQPKPTVTRTIISRPTQYQQPRSRLLPRIFCRGCSR